MISRISASKYLFGFAALFMLFSCVSETLESYYDTYALAAEAGALQRGWLPIWLPKESKRIYEWHNLDTNAVMWAVEVPLGTTVNLPNSCASAKVEGLPKPTFDRIWWPEGVPRGRVLEHQFFYFKCGDVYIGLAVAGGKLVGWSAGA